MRVGTIRVEEAAAFDKFAGFHAFHTEETQEPYGSFEIYFNRGWRWRSCFPGCLPDGEPSQPFATSTQALQDADEWNPEFDDLFEEIAKI